MNIWFAIAVVAILVVAYSFRTRTQVVAAVATAPTFVLTYEKVYGTVGKIYHLNIRSDGHYQIVSSNNTDRSGDLARSGTLTRAQMRAVHRLLFGPVQPCPLTATGADSVVSRLVYRGAFAPRVVNLGVLAYDKMPPQLSYDIAALEQILGNWRQDVVLP